MTEFKGDKRSKEFKAWKKKHAKASKGVGDTVDKITKATGIKKAVKWLAGDDCGCDERRDKLNYLFPYERPLCLTEDEFNYLSEIFETNKNRITTVEQNDLLKIYNRVFKDNREFTSCGSCFLNGVFKRLERIYKEYLD